MSQKGVFNFFLELLSGGAPLPRPCCLPSYLRGLQFMLQVSYGQNKTTYFEGRLAMPRDSTILSTSRVLSIWSISRLVQLLKHV